MEHYHDLHEAEKILDNLLLQEELHWKQRSRISWLEAAIEEITNFIQLSVTKETNQFLLAPFSDQEILDAIKSMPPDKSPGEDGMPAIFSQKNRRTVGSLVTKAVQEIMW
ncbi:hypothetical protein L484_016897 [Morus notabilis]|uniref:Reverse transcriptase domain-containing protein n=1 Tax=Morus notabilis TaxID=981085 RepID=W9SK15_9ROSA|nr:hypothetical protein L484_016897 [Morus notabilis]